MRPFTLIIIHLFFVLKFHVKAQVSPQENKTNSLVPTNLTILIGILSIMFSMSFILLIYAKLCYAGTDYHFPTNPQNLLPLGLIRSSSRFSGIDKAVIEALPFFRFSSLNGSKEGLECAVCLSNFEDIEVLRLLPKCKHAFHINCIDHWLEKHSTCPLCRIRVSVEDLTFFTYSTSMRYLLNNPSDRKELDTNIEKFVQREEENPRGSLRFRIGNLIRKEADHDKSNIDIGDHEKLFHKHKHKIIVSDFVFMNRWSNLSSSDLTILSSEMLGTTVKELLENEEVVKIKEERNTASTSQIINPRGRRSVLEITGLSRFADDINKKSIRECSGAEDGVKEERMRKLWFPIARRTVEWFANRERRHQQYENSQQQLDV